MGFFYLKSIRLSNTFTNFAKESKNNLFVRLQMVKDILALPSTVPNLTCNRRGARKDGPLLYYGT